MNTSGAPEAPAKFSVILLDDEESVVNALRLLLRAIGYEVNAFSSPPEALRFLESKPECNLFLCDLKMPGKNGIEVLQECRKIMPELAFVLMSAHATEADVEKARSLGARGFLAKPFTPEQFHSMAHSLSACNAK